MWVIYPILLLKTLASGSTLPLLKHVESDYVSKSSSCCELDPYCFFGNFNWYYSKKMIPHIFPISLSLPHGPDSSPASFAASMHDRTSLVWGALGPGVRKATKIKILSQLPWYTRLINVIMMCHNMYTGEPLPGYTRLNQWVQSSNIAGKFPK